MAAATGIRELQNPPPLASYARRRLLSYAGESNVLEAPQRGHDPVSVARPFAEPRPERAVAKSGETEGEADETRCGFW